MARPPHKLKKEKLIEGVGGLRIMDDVGIKIHKLKHLKLHGKMLLATMRARSSDRSIWRPAALTAAASWPSRWMINMWSNDWRKYSTTTGSTRTRWI